MSLHFRSIGSWVAGVLMLLTVAAPSQAPNPVTFQVSAHLTMGPNERSKEHHKEEPPAVLWLKPLSFEESFASSGEPQKSYTLLQKNKMFTPHLLVVPVGSTVLFPNADPFFHNVFSLFNGKRFDLGLYEAGTTKQVIFSHEGVSYIFCNIHPEMSAVVLSLSTPFYSIADIRGSFHLQGIPAGEYEVHLWVEGERESVLDRWTKRVRLFSNIDFGSLQIPAASLVRDHTNKFGQPYDKDAAPAY